jgi:septum site-determining protein MinD
VVVVTSGKGNIGKTTTTANLTASLARFSLPVVAVVADAGLRKLDLLLGLKNHVHLTIADVLAGDCRLNQALIRHRALQDL